MRLEALLLQVSILSYAYLRLTFLQIMALVVIVLGVPVSLLFQIFIHENATARPPKQKWYKWLMNPEFYLVSHSSKFSIIIKVMKACG